MADDGRPGPADEPRLLGRRAAYDGRVLRVSVDRVVLPGGASAELEIIRHPGAAVVVPLTDEGRVVLVRQYRYAVGGWLLEAPAGKLDPGEEPEACAHRELEEETGLRARELVPLGTIWSSPGFTDERLHLYLARGLQPGRQRLDDNEVLTSEQVDLAESVAMARDGRIADAKSVCALLRAAALLGV